MKPLRFPPGRLLPVAAAASLVMVILIGFFDAGAALRGWLAAFALVGSVPLGSLFLVMLLRLVPGRWRDDLLSPSENLLPTNALLLPAILPVLFGISHLYGWAGTPSLGGFQAVYLSSLFFSLRSLILLAAALLLAVLLLCRPAVKAVVVIGLIVFVLAHGLLATDWVLSLDPKFHASGFGLYFLCLQSLTALCVVILIRVATKGPQHPQILGGLLLTGILLWSYFAFLQYLIIWSDNLPDGAAWYLRRSTGVWHVAEIAMTVLRLAPGFLLLFGSIRRSAIWLMVLAIVVLLGSVIEMAWLVLPSTTGGLGPAVIAYLLAFAGLSTLLALNHSFSRPMQQRILATKMKGQVTP